MDTTQIKLLAARIRTLLQQNNCSIGHNQSLDLVAALTGLRNWPEVQAFPAQLAAAKLDAAAIARLAFRLKRKYNLEFSRERLHAALDPEVRSDLPQIWPTGPVPGVYVTTAQESINALLECFEVASDGALIYAESASNHWDGSIDLGDSGLWSAGLQRAPSGTLIVVGPIDLEQSSWDDSAQRLQMACVRARSDGHRVAVLARTPTPERLHEDVHLMVSALPDSNGIEDAFKGVVSADGELIERVPFAQAKRHDAFLYPPRHVPAVDTLPANVRSALKRALASYQSGIVVAGTGEIDERKAMDLAEGILALTPHCGPAARIMPRTRSTPAKYWRVSEAIRELPFLPSIQSAYDQGFRRMVVAGNYTDAALLRRYPDVLFISPGWGCHVTDALMVGMRASPALEEMVGDLIAIVAVTQLSSQLPELVICDLYVKPDIIPKVASYDNILKMIESHRVIRWESEFARLIAQFGVAQIVQMCDGTHIVRRTLDHLLSELQQRSSDQRNELAVRVDRGDDEIRDVRKKIHELAEHIRAANSAELRS